MEQLTLVAAFRKSENSVGVMYFHNELRQEFVVEWNNIHPATGGIERYDLQIACLSASENLNLKIKNAIREGDSDLYEEIRDTFDAVDCESV